MRRVNIRRGLPIGSAGNEERILYSRPLPAGGLDAKTAWPSRASRNGMEDLSYEPSSPVFHVESPAAR